MTPHGVGVALWCPAAPGGPTAVPKGAWHGVARAHLHLWPAVCVLGSVTNCMSPRPSHSPCPALSSVSSAAVTSAGLSCAFAELALLLAARLRQEPSRNRRPETGDRAGPRSGEEEAVDPRTEGQAGSARAIQAPRTWFCVQSRPGDAAASAAGAGMEAGRARQRGWGQG